jgi:hypothetical protein
MREPDADDFRKAMEKEIVDQWDNGNFRLFNKACGLSDASGTPTLEQ